MVNLILNAITKQLGTTFGNSYRYYIEDVEQGLKKPCFTVGLLLPTQRSKSPVLYERRMPVIIHYFSDSKKDIKKHCYSMGEQIIECLEYLPVEDTLIRAEDISFQIVDDVLQVFMTYGFTTKVVSESQDTIDEIETTVTHR